MGISLEGCILFAPLKRSTHINSRAFCYFLFLILFVTYEFEEVKRGGGEADTHTHTHIDRTAKSVGVGETGGHM